jgi:uncharacterized protein DUF5050
MTLRTAILLACCLGCDSGVLSNRPLVDHNGGRAGGPVNTGNAGTGAPGGDGGDARGGSNGNAGTGGSAGTGGTTGTGGPGPGAGGACAISCGPAACPVRDGQPRVLVTSPFNQQLMGLAVNADTLFWGTYPNQTQGEIRSMPLAGGPSTLLASNVIVSELYLDGSTLYYVSNDRTGNASLLAIPVTGGTSRMVATGSRIAWITSDASSIYFAQGNQIVRADRSGSGVTPVVGAAGTLWGFAVDETNVYWASYSNGGALARRALAGGNTTTLHTSSAPITFPITDGDDIVYMEGINTPGVCQSAIWATAKAGTGAPRLISPGTSGVDVQQPVRDGATLYWASNSPHGALLRMVKDQTPEILAAEQVNITRPVLGPADLYWIASGSGPTYEVRTLPK